MSVGLNRVVRRSVLILRLAGVFFACLAILAFGVIVEPPLSTSDFNIFAIVCAALSVLMFWTAKRQVGSR